MQICTLWCFLCRLSIFGRRGREDTLSPVFLLGPLYFPGIDASGDTYFSRCICWHTKQLLTTVVGVDNGLGFVSINSERDKSVIADWSQFLMYRLQSSLGASEDSWSLNANISVRIRRWNKYKGLQVSGLLWFPLWFDHCLLSDLVILLLSYPKRVRLTWIYDSKYDKYCRNFDGRPGHSTTAANWRKCSQIIASTTDNRSSKTDAEIENHKISAKTTLSQFSAVATAWTYQIY